ncbi:MAG: protein-glutamate O-methyltransferase CheR [bacterium]|nr:protein-glutamate O-methyltransferase CheR [bacterium]
MKLSVEDFIRLRNIVYAKAGIFFETKKMYLVKKRLQQRMDSLSITEPGLYCNMLKFDDKSGMELQQLLNLMTTNETYFFREKKSLVAFSDYCLPEILATGKKRLKIWSAGCSSGEEPYTLAILLNERIPSVNRVHIDITASDIDTSILEKAGKGVYDGRSVRNVPPPLLAKYFRAEGENYRVIDHLKRMVTFKHLNLLDERHMRMMRGIDFIFCRNVMIYFDEAARKSVAADFYDSLVPGGYVYPGSSESITRMNSAFKIKRSDGHILYHKPGPPGPPVAAGNAGMRRERNRGY